MVYYTLIKRGLLLRTIMDMLERIQHLMYVTGCVQEIAISMIEKLDREERTKDMEDDERWEGDYRMHD